MSSEVHFCRNPSTKNQPHALARVVVALTESLFGKATFSSVSNAFSILFYQCMNELGLNAFFIPVIGDAVGELHYTTSIGWVYVFSRITWIYRNDYSNIRYLFYYENGCIEQCR